MNFKKILTIASVIISLSTFKNVEAKGICLVLDPGHGGENKGAVRTYSEKVILEKDINLEIAKSIKQKLEKYRTKEGDEVKVILTREDDETCPNLEERVRCGVVNDTDAVISIHNNASENEDRRGAMVLVTNSDYNNLYEREEKIALCILEGLKRQGVSIVPDVEKTDNYEGKVASVSNSCGCFIGEVKDGLMRRLVTDGGKYANGDSCDWYGIVRHGVNKGILSILVENCYLSNKDDYNEFLSTQEGIDKLVEGNIQGIVKYFEL